MDVFSNLINTFDKEQKKLLTGAFILLPLLYTCLYLCSNTFASLDFAVQIIFSIAVTIVYTFMLLLSSLFAAILSEEDLDILIIMIQHGCVCTTFITMFSYFAKKGLWFLMLCIGISVIAPIIRGVVIWLIKQIKLHKSKNKVKK